MKLPGFTAHAALALQSGTHRIVHQNGRQEGNARVEAAFERRCHYDPILVCDDPPDPRTCHVVLVEHCVDIPPGGRGGTMLDVGRLLGVF